MINLCPVLYHLRFNMFKQMPSQLTINVTFGMLLFQFKYGFEAIYIIISFS